MINLTREGGMYKEKIRVSDSNRIHDQPNRGAGALSTEVRELMEARS